MNIKILRQRLEVFVSAVLVATLTTSCATTNWQFISRMSVARSGHTATLLNDGRVLVVGGLNSDGVLATAEIYDPNSQTWSPVASMRTPRVRHTATLMADGTVLVVGGAQDLANRYTASVERFDPPSGTWAFVKSMSSMRAFHVAALLTEGSLLVVGGNTSSFDSQLSAERYFPGNNTWVSAGKSRAPHTHGTATLMPDGTVLVTGGEQYSPDVTQRILIPYSERYDKDADRWFELASMEPVLAHTATLLNDETVLVAGGRAVPTLRNAVRYDPWLATGNDYPPTWNATSNLINARSNHQATRLPSGDVLVTGGFLDCIDRTNPPGCSSSLATVELYHPTPGSRVDGGWTKQEDMFNARGDHTATLLQNGTVLATGGYSWSTQSALDTAEIFWPQGRPTN